MYRQSGDILCVYFIIRLHSIAIGVENLFGNVEMCTNKCSVVIFPIWCIGFAIDVNRCAAA